MGTGMTVTKKEHDQFAIRQSSTLRPKCRSYCANVGKRENTHGDTTRYNSCRRAVGHNLH